MIWNWFYLYGVGKKFVLNIDVKNLIWLIPYGLCGWLYVNDLQTSTYTSYGMFVLHL